MAYHITKKQSVRIVGISISLVDDMEENYKTIPEFWQSTLGSEQFTQICNLSNQEPQGILGITVYENPQKIFYYIAVATTAPVPPGMFEYEIPAATWVVFENNGHFKEKVQSIFRRFYTEWLPFSGYNHAGLPDIEVYPIFETPPTSGHSEVWIAINKNKEE